MTGRKKRDLRATDFDRFFEEHSLEFAAARPAELHHRGGRRRSQDAAVRFNVIGVRVRNNGDFLRRVRVQPQAGLGKKNSLLMLDLHGMN